MGLNPGLRGELCSVWTFLVCFFSLPWSSFRSLFCAGVMGGLLCVFVGGRVISWEDDGEERGEREIVI